MLNFDVKEMIYNNLKEKIIGVENYDNLFDIKNCWYKEYIREDDNLNNIMKYFKQYIYCEDELRSMLLENAKFCKKDNKFQIKIGTTKKIYNHFLKKSVENIENKVKIDYKKLIFNNELRTNKLEVVKKYTDDNFKKNMKKIINEEIDYHKEDVLENCLMCEKCSKIVNVDDEHEYMLVINDKYLCRYCWKCIDIQNSVIIASYDELIDYNCFNWNEDNEDIVNDKFLEKNLKNEIVYAIHQHNIKLMLDNEKKYTKKDLIYEMRCFNLYGVDNISDVYTPFY